MKCPYTVDTEQVQQDTYEYNTDGYNTFHESKMLVKRLPIDCIGNECGAFIDGRCRYKQD